MAESITLYDASGNRKFVTREERDRFLRTAATCLGEVRTLCGVLAYTGCHITEALELTFERVDIKRRTLTFESIRKRKPKVFRTVPVPPKLIEVLDQVHNIKERRGQGRYRFLWPWGRTHAWRKVREVMQMAGIEGPQATSRGLRHGFGVIAAENNIPRCPPWRAKRRRVVPSRRRSFWRPVVRSAKGCLQKDIRDAVEPLWECYGVCAELAMV